MVSGEFDSLEMVLKCKARLRHTKIVNQQLMSVIHPTFKTVCKMIIFVKEERFGKEGRLL